MDERCFSGSLVMTGGGTGGHYFPAVALAEGAQARWPGRPVAFVGARRGIEGRLLPQSPWQHLLLDVEGFMGRSPLSAIRAALKLAQARSRLKAIWRRQRPWAVVGTGGYGAAPALLAARALGIPYFLHESNAQPGQLVKLLARGAAGVWCGMDAVRTRLPGARCVLAGTPVRSAFLREFLPWSELRPPSRLLVLGGSGGALALNAAIVELAPALLERFPQWDLLHQAGPAGFQALTGAGVQLHARHRLVPFLEGMDRELEAASLVLTRSGASTCAELKACGRPALMVPMPGSAGNHQFMNAQAMVEEGRAVLVPQGPGLGGELLAAAARLMDDPGLLATLARPEPNQAVATCLEDLEEHMPRA
ncbi:MAG: UDP-N-acetylglucosamine--N-acetylmuramyl-(pentapeptide) pyrophosphoryl-undecaprenol N-acetylglucosamine transferase [Holophaga sp.]|nr:UDP-N-acetylglucosamine--N-acetylmuramyl-(pentapeptide) pyrophosphoryl-undecaprenol N-acetylglucosamine transferase [Holophaga sp.]